MYAKKIAARLQGLPVDTPLPLPTLLSCGAVSGACTSFVLTPFELVKCRAQVESNLHKTAPRGPLAIAQNYVASAGVCALWRGQTGTLIREAGGTAAWFGAYEGLTHFYKQRSHNQTLTTWQLMTAGAAAGVSYHIFFFPADSVKSRVQALSSESDAAAGSFMSTARDMYRNGGPRIFYRGLGITAARVMFWS